MCQERLWGKIFYPGGCQLNREWHAFQAQANLGNSACAVAGDLEIGLKGPYVLKKESNGSVLRQGSVLCKSLWIGQCQRRNHIFLLSPNMEPCSTAYQYLQKWTGS